jgi:hypothetical protein
LFSKLQIQIEGWFRGELMHYINNNRDKTQIQELTTNSREVPVHDKSRRKVDLRIETNNEMYWIELKHILIGKQKANGFRLKDYFSEGTYIANDIKKLGCIKSDPKKIQHKFCLVFLSTNGWGKDSGGKDPNSKNEVDTLREQIQENLNKYNAKNKIRNGPDYVFNYSKGCNFGYFLFEV